MKTLVIAGLLIGVSWFVQAAGQPQTVSRTFPIDSAVYSGQFTNIVAVTTAVPYRRFDGIDSAADLGVTGTSLTVACRVAGPAAVEAQVDGDAWTDITPSALNVATNMPVFSDLPDGPHTVTIRAKQSVFFYLDGSTAGCFTVTGKTPGVAPPAAVAGKQYILNATAPDPLGRPGILDHVRLEGGYGPGQIRFYDLLQPMMQALGSAKGYLQYNFGTQFRFRATIRELAIWTYLDGSKFALLVDGAIRAPVPTPARNRWGWLTLATDLDPSA
ncbi:hypothetical protein HQ590_06790, partial [bacterium]|nr:hypothetical protein [bacterium]